MAVFIESRWVSAADAWIADLARYVALMWTLSWLIQQH